MKFGNAEKGYIAFSAITELELNTFQVEISCIYKLYIW